MKFSTDHFLYGGDYNPEQWLSTPEILEEDIILMKQAHVNAVTLGVFAWSALEPSNDEYHFEWLERIIDRLYENGISVILATPSGARPKWLAQRWPEVLRTDAFRRRALYGGRHNHCYSSPVYRKKTAQIDRLLAQRFGRHPAVILWHVSNEFGGECHCALCQQSFREWLQARYGTISRLNEAWYTLFWSHIYDSFDDVESPSPLGEEHLMGLNLDWKRFVTERTGDFLAHEIHALREGGARQPVTTNFMYDYAGLDYQKLSDLVDIVSWDAYPLWHSAPDARIAAECALQHDRMRSIRKEPFLLMESALSSTNWQPVSRLKRPGLLQAQGLQALAHGSDSILYFQMRQSRGASEKLHSALIGHSGTGDTRVFHEAAQTGLALQQLRELCGTQAPAHAAVFYDTQNRWALEGSEGPRNAGIYYRETVQKCYNALRRLGLNVDVLDQTQPLEGYHIVAAPMLYQLRGDIVERLCEFVERGGSLLCTALTGVTDDSDLCFLGATPYGMTELLGLQRTEVDALYDGESNTLVRQAADTTDFAPVYRCSHLCELIKLSSAKPLLVYGEDFYRGTPAATINQYGRGFAFYLSADAEDSCFNDLLRFIALRAQLPIRFPQGLPEGWELTERIGPQGSYIFLQNFSNASQPVPTLPAAQFFWGTRGPKNVDLLSPFDTAIFKLPASEAFDENNKGVSVL